MRKKTQNYYIIKISELLSEFVITNISMTSKLCQTKNIFKDFSGRPRDCPDCYRQVMDTLLYLVLVLGLTERQVMDTFCYTWSSCWS